MSNINRAEMLARKITRNNHLKYLPHNLDVVINYLGIIVIYETFDKLGALLNKEEKLMLVNRSCSYVEQRFHISHEIGHYVLNHEGNFFQSLLQLKEHSIKKSKIEQEADIFASELLIPSTKLRRIGFLNNYDVIKLKQIFAVSEKAMAYKLFRLNLPYKNTRYKFYKKF